MTDITANLNAHAGLQIQQKLENAVSAAVEDARREAAAHPDLGHPKRRRRDDYYALVALHRVFLMACGAQVESQRGGDVRKASKILHVGATIAQGWKEDDANSKDVKLPASSGFSEDDLRSREELRLSAGGLVYGTIVKALVAHVSKEDADFRSRVILAIEALTPMDDSGSEQAEMFSEFVQSSTRNLLGEPK